MMKEKEKKTTVRSAPGGSDNQLLKKYCSYHGKGARHFGGTTKLVVPPKVP